MLNLLFLGTGAADWDPSKASSDPEFRRLTAALVSDDLMIDCGPCVYEFASTFGYPNLYQNVSDLLITHSHDDHFCPESIARLCGDAAKAGHPVYVHGDAAIQKMLPDCENLCFVPAVCFVPFSAGKYTVTAVPANHTAGEDQPLHYIITNSTQDKTFFWGCDGSWLLKQTFLEISRHKYDAMIFDCTVGDIKGDYRIFEHNNIHMLEEMVMSLRDAHHLLKQDGKFYACHMARTLHTDHNKLAKRLSEQNIIPARDNLKIEM